MKKAIQNALHDRLPAVLAGQYRQTWHLMADIGWISDPTGSVSTMACTIFSISTHRHRTWG